MTTPDSFATSDDAAAYGFTLAGGAAAGLLARATQALRDAAGIPITQTTSTLEIDAHDSALHIPTPLVSSVTSVELVGDDGNTTVTDFRWRPTRPHRIRLGHELTHWQRHHGLFAVTYVHGFTDPLPPALVMLTASVAYRLSVTPPGALAGLKSKTVGSVSWTAGDMPAAKLSAAEECSLGRIVPVKTVWQVPV